MTALIESSEFEMWRRRNCQNDSKNCAAVSKAPKCYESKFYA